MGVSIHSKRPAAAARIAAKIPQGVQRLAQS